MQNQRGFVGVGVLIAILVGVAVLGGGAYYVVNQQSAEQMTSENFDNLQQLPTTNTQVQQKQATTGNTPSQTMPTKNTEPTSRVYVSPQGYSIRVPMNATTEEFPIVGDEAVSMTVIKGTFGFICISIKYGCDGRGPVGSDYSEKMITSTDGNLKLQLYASQALEKATLSVKPQFNPTGWDIDRGIINGEIRTSEQNQIEDILATLDF